MYFVDPKKHMLDTVFWCDMKTPFFHRPILRYISMKSFPHELCLITGRFECARKILLNLRGGRGGQVWWGRRVYSWKFSVCLSVLPSFCSSQFSVRYHISILVTFRWNLGKFPPNFRCNRYVHIGPYLDRIDLIWIICLWSAGSLLWSLKSH